MDKAKPFCIPKRAVWEAYKRVRANHGAAGVDGQTIAQFEEDLKANLYKLWNRMSSGSYMAAAGETGGDTEGQWRWGQAARNSDAWPTVLPKRWSKITWSRSWMLASMSTLTGTGRRSLRKRLWLWRERVAGVMTGYLSLIFGPSLIISPMSSCYGRYAVTLTASGYCCMWSGG